MTPLLRWLRLGTGLVLVGSVLVAGALPRGAWIVAPLTAAFTAAFAIGRWRAWCTLLRQRNMGKLIAALAATAAVQAVLVATLYLIGRGVAAVFGRPAPDTFGAFDIVYAGAVAAVGIGFGGFIAWCESRAWSNLAPRDDADRCNEADGTRMDAEIRLRPEPVTPHSLFAAVHYTHLRHSLGGGASAASTGPVVTEAILAAAEARLGVALPETLRALYRAQNGGSINRVCIPKTGIRAPRRYDDVLMPFSGYNDLLPCEKLRTVFGSTTDFADPDDPDQRDMFPAGSRQLVVLAQWYRETLFLDYRNGAPPSVGFVDFDHADWEAHVVRWPGFEAFFAALRHYEDADDPGQRPLHDAMA